MHRRNNLALASSEFWRCRPSDEARMCERLIKDTAFIFRRRTVAEINYWKILAVILDGARGAR
jgi:hypothetical protein